MAHIFAILDAGNTVIVNTVSADTGAAYPGSIQIDLLVPIPGIGWTFSGGIFTPPVGPAPPTPVLSSVFSKLQFRLLFTLAELQGLDNIATSGLSAGVIKAVTTHMVTFAQADHIDMAAPYVVTALNAAATAGLITPARAAALLASTH